jgi:transposase
LDQYLDEWKDLDARIARIEAEIDEHIGPFEEAVALWQSIPDADRVTACNLVEEPQGDLGLNDATIAVPIKASGQLISLP